MASEVILGRLARGDTSGIHIRVKDYLAPVMNHQTVSPTQQSWTLKFCRDFLRSSLPHLSPPDRDILAAIRECCDGYRLLKKVSTSERDTVDMCHALYRVVAKLPPQQEYCEDLLSLSEFLVEELSTVSANDETRSSICACGYSLLWNSAIKLEPSTSPSTPQSKKSHTKSHTINENKENIYTGTSHTARDIFIVTFKLRQLSLKCLLMKSKDVDTKKLSTQFCQSVSIYLQKTDCAKIAGEKTDMLVSGLCDDVCSKLTSSIYENTTVVLQDITIHSFKELLQKQQFTEARSVVKVMQKYKLTTDFDNMFKSSDNRQLLPKLFCATIDLHAIKEKTSHENVVQLTTKFEMLLNCIKSKINDLDFRTITTLLLICSWITTKIDNLLGVKSKILQDPDLRVCFFDLFKLHINIVTLGLFASTGDVVSEEVKKRHEKWTSLQVELYNVGVRWLVLCLQTQTTECTLTEAVTWLENFSCFIKSSKGRVSSQKLYVPHYNLGIQAQIIAKLTGERSDIKEKLLQLACQHLRKWCCSDKALVQDRLKQVKLWHVYDSLASQQTKLGRLSIAMTTIVNRVLIDQSNLEHAVKVWVATKLESVKENGVSSVHELTLVSAIRNSKAEHQLSDVDLVDMLRCELRVIRPYSNLAKGELKILIEIMALTESDALETGIALVNIARLLYIHPTFTYHRSNKEMLDAVIVDLDSHDQSDTSVLMTRIEAHIWRYFIVQDSLRVVLESVRDTTPTTSLDASDTSNVINDETLSNKGKDNVGMSIPCGVEAEILADIDAVVQMVQKFIASGADYTEVAPNICDSLNICANIYSLVYQPYKVVEARTLIARLSTDTTHLYNLLDSLLDVGHLETASCVYDRISDDIRDIATIEGCRKLVVVAKYHLLSRNLEQFYEMVESILASAVITSTATRHNFLIEGTCQRLLSQAALLPHDHVTSPRQRHMTITAYHTFKCHLSVAQCLLGQQLMDYAMDTDILRSGMSITDGMTALHELLQSTLHIGRVHTMLGSARDAVLELKEGLKLANALALPKWSVLFLQALARLHILQNLTDDADGCVQKSRHILLTSQDDQNLAQFLETTKNGINNTSCKLDTTNENSNLNNSNVKSTENSGIGKSTENLGSKITESFKSKTEENFGFTDNFGFDDDDDFTRKKSGNFNTESKDLKDSREKYIQKILHGKNCDCIQCRDFEISCLFLKSLSIETQKLNVDNCAVQDILNETRNIHTVIERRFSNVYSDVSCKIGDILPSGGKFDKMSSCDKNVIGRKVCDVSLLEKVTIEAECVLKTGHLENATKSSVNGLQIANITNLTLDDFMIVRTCQIQCSLVRVKAMFLTFLAKNRPRKNTCDDVDDLVSRVKNLDVNDTKYPSTPVGGRSDVAKNVCKTEKRVTKNTKPKPKVARSKSFSEEKTVTFDVDEVFAVDKADVEDKSRDLFPGAEQSSQNVDIKVEVIAETKTQSRRKKDSSAIPDDGKPPQTKTKIKSDKKPTVVEPNTKNTDPIEFDDVISSIKITKTPARNKIAVSADFMTPKLLCSTSSAMSNRRQALALLMDDNIDDLIPFSAKKPTVKKSTSKHITKVAETISEKDIGDVNSDVFTNNTDKINKTYKTPSKSNVSKVNFCTPKSLLKTPGMSARKKVLLAEILSSDDDDDDAFNPVSTKKPTGIKPSHLSSIKQSVPRTKIDTTGKRPIHRSKIDSTDNLPNPKQKLFTDASFDETDVLDSDLITGKNSQDVFMFDEIDVDSPKKKVTKPRKSTKNVAISKKATGIPDPSFANLRENSETSDTSRIKSDSATQLDIDLSTDSKASKTLTKDIKPSKSRKPSAKSKSCTKGSDVVVKTESATIEKHTSDIRNFGSNDNSDMIVDSSKITKNITKRSTKTNSIETFSSDTSSVDITKEALPVKSRRTTKTPAKTTNIDRDTDGAFDVTYIIKPNDDITTKEIKPPKITRKISAITCSKDKSSIDAKKETSSKSSKIPVKTHDSDSDMSSSIESSKENNASKTNKNVRKIPTKTIPQDSNSDTSSSVDIKTENTTKTQKNTRKTSIKPTTNNSDSDENCRLERRVRPTRMNKRPTRKVDDIESARSDDLNDTISVLKNITSPIINLNNVNDDAKCDRLKYFTLEKDMFINDNSDNNDSANDSACENKICTPLKLTTLLESENIETETLDICVEHEIENIDQLTSDKIGILSPICPDKHSIRNKINFDDPIELPRSGRVVKSRVKTTRKPDEGVAMDMGERCPMTPRKSVEIERDLANERDDVVMPDDVPHYAGPQGDLSDLSHTFTSLSLTDTSDLRNLLHTTFTSLRPLAPSIHYRDICHLCALYHVSKDPSAAAYYLSEAQAVAFRHRMIDNLGYKERSTKSSKATTAEDAKASQMRDSIDFSSWTVDNFSDWCGYIPKGWTVCIISMVTSFPGNQELILTRLQTATPPIVVNLHGLHSKQGKKIIPEFSSIIAQSKSSFQVKDKKQWWKLRTGLDSQLQALLTSIETYWLAEWKCLLHSDPVSNSHDLLTQLTHNVQLDCARLATKLPSHYIQLILKTFAHLSESDISSIITDVTELWAGSHDYVTMMSSLLQNGKQFTGNGARYPTVLVLDTSIQQLPWESLPILRNHPTCRVPSLHFMVSQLHYNLLDQSSLFQQGVDKQKTWYILDPDNNLPWTKKTFADAFNREDGWQGIVGQKPSKEQFTNALTRNDLLIYCGHGSGSQYYHGDNLRKLRCQATALLMGCGSGQLKVEGQLEATGMVQYYSLADCPCIVANLWDVTDRDIDRFLQRLLDVWLWGKGNNSSSEVKGNNSSAKGKGSNSSSEGKGSNSSADVMHQSRDACQLSYLVGAAPVIYGFPMYLRDCVKK